MTTPTSPPARILELWRYPVKSVGGERVEVAQVGVAGISGDRQWGIVDVETGHMLTARRQPELLYASARLVDDAVEIVLPSGNVAANDQGLSDWLGHEVTLVSRADTTEPQSFEIATDFENESGSPWVNWKGNTWSFHDSRTAAVSVLSTGSIGTWDSRRFRANVIVERDTELDFVGREITAGDVTLLGAKGIERCVMVTRPLPPNNDGVPAARELDILREINQTRSAILGVGCSVTNGGHVRVGQYLACRNEP